MRSHSTRCPAHAKALATVTRISFTLAGVGALGGCIESPHPAGEPWADQIDSALADAAADTFGPIDGMADDVGQAALDGGVSADGMSDAIALDPEPEPDAAPDMHGDAVVWSETTPCPGPEEDYDAWLACCEARGWGSDVLCAAWGPPMPPRMLT